MKFDIARAWKDETYRQTLSEEELSMLPANPAGELSDADLEAVNGAWGGGFGGGFGGPGFGWGGSTFVYEHNESVAVLCELNIFSINILANIAILGSAIQHCIKG